MQMSEVNTIEASARRPVPDDEGFTLRDFERSERAIRYLAEHVDEQPALAAVAEHVHLSSLAPAKAVRCLCGGQPQGISAIADTRARQGAPVRLAARAGNLRGPRPVRSVAIA